MMADNSLQNTSLNLLSLEVYKWTQGLYDIIGHIFHKFLSQLILFERIV